MSDDNSKPPDSSSEGKIAVFLHGMLGNKRNVKSFAAKVCSSLGIRGLLMDVRGHGDSQLPESVRRTSKGSTFLDCVWDMDKTLLAEVPNLDDLEVILMGHSMGGRVAMMYSVTDNVSKKPSHVWLLDTVPGKLSASVQNVMGVAQKLVAGNDNFILGMTRNELASFLVKDHNIELGTAHWLAASFDPSLPRKFKFDLNVAFDLAEDFQNIDFTACLEQARQDQQVGWHVVRGGANTAWEDSSTLDFFQTWEKQEPNRMKFSFHTLPNAGHWVHIDDPKGLLDAVESIHKSP
ncbi:hypothetical protein ACA910_003130 [Epithemia clementina (nom. ined.)]